MKKFFTLIYISSDGSDKKQFNVNILLFKSIIIFIVIFFISVIIMTVYLGKIYSDAAQKQIYENRVRTLEKKLSKMEEIQKDIKYLYNKDKKINALLGINIQNDILNNHKEKTKSVKIDTMITMKSLKKQMREIPDIWPIHGIVSREFSSAHPAIDIAATKGSPIVAPISGKIISIGWDKIFGNYIKMKKDNIILFFGHLQKIFVLNDQSIKKGEVIGLVGNSGKSTAPHLHYEIMIDSIFVNPRNFLP